MNGKLKMVVLLVGLGGVAVALLMEEGAKSRLSAENADLRNQLAQVSSLQESNQALSDQLQATVQGGQSNQQELARLRGQSVRLRQLERENGQLKTQAEQLQRQVSDAQQRQQASAVAVEAKPKPVAPPTETDLGPLELADGVAVRFDLGGGTNCFITPSALTDGNIATKLSVVFANPDGTTTELGASRVTSTPGQRYTISIGDRVIGLAVTLKSQ